jgi:hypothetical protein
MLSCPFLIRCETRIACGMLATISRRLSDTFLSQGWSAPERIVAVAASMSSIGPLFFPIKS